MKKILIYSLILLFTGNSLFAQLDTKNTAVVYISSATDTFFVAGSFTNISGSAFTNNGIFQVKKDLINDQSGMATGTGTLYLNGSSAQVVSGSQTFKTYNLISNNASGITLNNDLSVSGTHTFSAGMITTSSAPNYMIYESAATYAGDADNKHINGWVKKIGSTNFIFPVGNGTYERPVALTNLAAVSEFNVRHNGAVTPNRYSLYNPLVFVDSAEYWTINRVSGGAARVAMNWDNSKIAFPMLMLSDIRAAYYDGVFWRGIGGTASGSVATSGSITSNSTNIFNTNFVIGSNSYVLPIKIISFTAGHVNGYSKINWTIANELNVNNYELERSDDGINFYTISTQNPFNNNNTEFYSYDDRKAIRTIAYYRLKINNLGSQINYSKVITLATTDNGKDLYVVTNPVEDYINIYADAAVKGIYNYTISNTSGQMMQSGVLDIKYGGIHSIRLQSLFSSGAYILVVKNAENILQKTIIKK